MTNHIIQNIIFEVGKYSSVFNEFMTIKIVSYSSKIILLVYTMSHLMISTHPSIVSISLSIICPCFFLLNIKLSKVSLIFLSIAYSRLVKIHTSSIILYFLSLIEIFINFMTCMLSFMHVELLLQEIYLHQYPFQTLVSLNHYFTSPNHLLFLLISVYEPVEGLD